MLKKIDITCTKIGLKMNLSKTQCLTNLNPSEKLTIRGQNVKLIEKHVYLRHEVRIGRNNQTCEIGRRIALAWTAYRMLFTHGDVF